jgi:hypothetical protein
MELPVGHAKLGCGYDWFWMRIAMATKSAR